MSRTRGKLEFVKRLLTEGQDPNSPGEGAEMPLHIAADRRRLAIAAALTQACADPNAVSPLDGATPLSAAAAHGDLRIVQHLLQAHASLDLPGSNGRTPLLMASIHGHLGVVEHLVEEHADVDKPGVGQAAFTNPLWSAAECNHSRIVATLLRARADVDWNNVEGRTPLWCAVANGSLQSARYLLKAGASVNCTDQHGDAPLWVAVACGQPEAVECLIAALADVNQVAGNGQSPLCTAALRCDLPAVRRLLRAGADVSDWQGRSPADLTISTEAHYHALLQSCQIHAISNTIAQRGEGRAAQARSQDAATRPAWRGLSLNRFRAWGYFRLESVRDFWCRVGEYDTYPNMHDHRFSNLCGTFMWREVKGGSLT